MISDYLANCSILCCILMLMLQKFWINVAIHVLFNSFFISIVPGILISETGLLLETYNMICHKYMIWANSIFKISTYYKTNSMLLLFWLFRLSYTLYKLFNAIHVIFYQCYWFAYSIPYTNSTQPFLKWLI